MSQKSIEDFRIAEEVKKKLKERFRDSSILQMIMPPEIGIIGQIFRECEEERIIKNLKNLLKDCGKEKAMTFEERVMKKTDEKLEEYLKSKYATLSVNAVREEFPVLLWLHQEAEREIIMEEIELIRRDSRKKFIPATPLVSINKLKRREK